MMITKQALLIGHESKRAALKRLFNKQRIPPSFILAGPSGIGKKQVAFELYRTFYCDIKNDCPYGGCRTCKSCNLFDSKTLPYLRFLDCSQKEENTVETMRQLLHGLHLKAGNGQSRIVILDNADNLSTHSQNILLKTLEEPRPDTFFCLIAANPSKLLNTIQSRCQVWFFDSLSDEQVLKIIEAQNFASDLKDIDAKALALLADGSLSNINTLIDHQHEWQETKELIKLTSKMQFNQVFTDLQKIKSDKDTLRMRLSIFRIIARQAMLKATDAKKSYAWSVFVTNIILAEQFIFERNLSAELVLQNLCLSLVQPSRHQTFTPYSHDARLLSFVTV